MNGFSPLHPRHYFVDRRNKLTRIDHWVLILGADSLAVRQLLAKHAAPNLDGRSVPPLSLRGAR